MDSVIAAIKARIEECKAKGKMFEMPKIEGCPVEMREGRTSGSTLVHTEFVLRLSDGRFIKVDYQSKDCCDNECMSDIFSNTHSEGFFIVRKEINK